MNKQIVSVGVAVVVSAFPAAAQNVKDVLLSQVKESCAALASVERLLITATSHFAFDPAFLHYNPRFGKPGESEVVEKYNVTTSGNLFKIAVDFYPTKGGEKLGYLRVFDGVNTMFRYANNAGLLTTRKGANLTPDNQAPLGTVLLLPYGFLFPTNETDKVSIVTPIALSESANWDGFAENIQESRVERRDANVVKVTRKDGSYFRVEFDVSKGYFPKAFTLYASSGESILNYKALSLGAIVANGKNIYYAKVATYSRFLKALKTSERRICIDRIEIPESVADDEFALDPTSADVIWDEDNKVSIRIAK